MAYGTVFGTTEKIGIVRRILLGLEAEGIEAVWFLPEREQIVPRALASIQQRHYLRIQVHPLSMHVSFEGQDSFRAALALKQLGVRCIITLGGDGTNRQVAKGCGSVPLLPVSTGTNNVFPYMIEGTIAGLAGGRFSQNPSLQSRWTHRSKRIVLARDGIEKDIALVDVAIISQSFIASRAIWCLKSLRRLFLTRAESCSLGLSSIGARLHPVRATDPFGLDILFGPHGTHVEAPIAPGLIEKAEVQSWQLLPLEKSIPLVLSQGTIALDGEREIEIPQQQQWTLVLDQEGPWVVDPSLVLDTIRSSA